MHIRNGEYPTCHYIWKNRRDSLSIFCLTQICHVIKTFGHERYRLLWSCLREFWHIWSTVRKTTEKLERLMVTELTGGIKIGKYKPHALNRKKKKIEKLCIHCWKNSDNFDGKTCSCIFFNIRMKGFEELNHIKIETISIKWYISFRKKYPLNRLITSVHLAKKKFWMSRGGSKTVKW